MPHTILLFQPGSDQSKTYSDYETENDCMEGICCVYENHLKRLNPTCSSITYDMSNLFEFLDHLTDVSCLVYQRNTNTYAPYNKSWIKERIYILMKNRATAQY